MSSFLNIFYPFFVCVLPLELYPNTFCALNVAHAPKRTKSVVIVNGMVCCSLALGSRFASIGSSFVSASYHRLDLIVGTTF